MRFKQPIIYFKQAVHLSFSHYSIAIFFCFCLFIALAPSFDLISWAQRYDEKRIVQVILVLLAASQILFSKPGAKHFLRILFSLPRLSRWGLAIVTLLGLISSLTAPAIKYATLELSLFILLVSFSFTVALLMQSYNQILVGSLLVATTVSAFCYEITFFTSYIGIFIQGNPLVLPEPFSGFSNIRFFNQFQIWTLPLIALPLLLYPRLFASIRGLLIILIIGWWVLLFASQSRGAQLAIFLAVIITLLVFRNDSWSVIKTNVISAISGWVAYYFLFVYMPDLETKSRLAQLTEDPARLQLWELALKMASENPWFGVGPMHYAYYPNDIAAHPHSSLLQIASEWGLPVAVILVVLAGWGSYAWSAKYFKENTLLRNNNQHHLWIALFCSLMAGMAYSIVSGVIVMPLSQTMFSVVVGMMLGLYFAPSLSSGISTITSNTLRFLSGAIIVGVLWSLSPDIMIRMETEAPMTHVKVSTFGPRFWQEGGIPH